MRSALLLLLVARAAVAAPAPRLAIGLDEHLGAVVPRDLTLIDSTGRAARLGHYFDGARPVVLVMAYARCTMLCSVVLRGLAAAARTSPAVAGRDYLPIVVSLDPHETPDEAARRQNRLLAQIGRPGERDAWPYLVGDAPTVAALADALGFRYAWDPATKQYAHPAVVFVLTPDGRIAEYLRDLGFDGLAPAVARAARGQLTGQAAGDLLRCFRFEPALRRYGAAIALLYRLSAAVVLSTLAILIVALVGVGAPEARAMNELFRRLLFLPPQASSVARDIDILHYTVIGAGFVVAALTFLLIGYFLLRYRERPDAPPRPRPVSHSLEVTLAAITLGVFLAWWVVGFAQYRRLRDVPDGALRVHVVAKQWMWQFVYPSGLAAEDELRVPVGAPVELVLTARDVIHSFYVPAFRLKQDVVPGRITSMWFTASQPGSYDILCAEYCGAGHSRMRGRVIAMPADEYARWSQSQSAPGLAHDGAAIAARAGCLRCHSVDGSPNLGPTWRGLYRQEVALMDGRRVIADDAYLTESMMDPGAKLVAGYPPIMPSYLGAVSGPDAAALVEYIRSLGEAP